MYGDKKIAVLVGTVITLIVFGIVLWFLIPSSKIYEKVTVNGDATVETIGMAFTLIDLHSVSALWSGSTMVVVFVVFLILGCCCKNKALKQIHSHVKAKLQQEFVQIGSEFHVKCRLVPDTSNTNVGAQVGYQAASSVLGIQAEVKRRALLEKRARRDRARREMEELEEEETRLEIEHKKAMLESKRRHQKGRWSCMDSMELLTMDNTRWLTTGSREQLDKVEVVRSRGLSTTVTSHMVTATRM